MVKYKKFREWNDELTRYDNGKIIEKAKTIFKVIDKNSNSSLIEMNQSLKKNIN